MRKPPTATPLPSQDRMLAQTAEKAEVTPNRSLAEMVVDAVEMASERLGPSGRRRKPSVPFVAPKPRPENDMRGRTAGSLKALERHRNQTLFGGPRDPRPFCKSKRKDGQPCRGVRIYGSDYCRVHGGLRRQEIHWRLTYADYRYSRHRFGRRALMFLWERGAITQELLRQEPFREIFERAVRGIRLEDPRFHNWHHQHRRMHYERCVELSLAMVAGWDAIQTRNDWTGWQNALRAADEEGPWRKR